MWGVAVSGALAGVLSQENYQNQLSQQNVANHHLGTLSGTFPIPPPPVAPPPLTTKQKIHIALVKLEKDLDDDDKMWKYKKLKSIQHHIDINEAMAEDLIKDIVP